MDGFGSCIDGKFNSKSLGISVGKASQEYSE